MKRFARKMKNIALGKRSRFAVLSLLFIVTFAIPLATSFVHSPAAAAISKQSDYGNPDCSLTTASNISCKFKDGTVVGFGFDKYQNGRFEFTNITSSATKCGSGNGLFEYSSSGIDPSPTISSTSLVLGLKNAAGNCIKFNGTVSVSNPNNVDRNPVIAGLGNSIHGCVDVDTGADCSNDPNATCDTDAGGDAKCDSDELNCQGGSLSWILCPVIKLAQDAANQVDDFITNALNIDVSDIFANNETSGTP
ncbi:MAG TPA: hypothetical protein VG992_04390, partial [Candidatus Saccharimonadales bacterium]|nr:hypothetical protein [Candidatus Saccharimonadales bacterium]